MDFAIPTRIKDLLAEIDAFIAAEIHPLEAQGDNARFFDHRREHARTDWDNEGLPRPEWEALLKQMQGRADKAGLLRLALPEEFGGRDVGNLAMACIREHLANKPIGLHNDPQTEKSIVGNFPQILMYRDFGRPGQRETWINGSLDGSLYASFALTEPDHGSDATWMKTRAVRDGNGWRITGAKMWNTAIHVSTHDIVFCRTSGKQGDAKGISAFIVPMDSPGVKIESYYWTFNMPTDHAHVTFQDVYVPDDALLGPLDDGLVLARHFVNENRIRQAASSLGAGVFCLDAAVEYAMERKPFGKPLAINQGIQFPTVELATQAEMLRLLIHKTAWEMDQMTGPEVQAKLSDKVSMCNYWANRFCCEAADWAIQVHGGLGYSRHKPFEHIYRHYRRYRITEGTEQMQMRNVAGHLFGFIGAKRANAG
ncbi:MAG: acyl-CoA dehydrogenase [Sphingomonadales bacterium]|nr:MAG: acyl-CoA dehydrogenase [Sphingomonadales bacterium]